MIDIAGQSVKYADSLYKSDNYAEAEIAYERAVYLFDDKLIKAYSLLQKARCYKHLSSYQKAIYSLNRISFFQLPDSLNFQVRYEIALNYYLLGNFTEADAQLEQMNFYIRDTALTNQSLILQVLTDNQLLKFDKAKQEALHFINIVCLDSNVRTMAYNKINSFYSKKEIPTIKNVKTAQWLSVFIPGAGQMYAGYPIEGILNLLLHIGTLAFAAEEFYNGFYVTSYLGGLGLFQKFYFGSYTRAAFLANKHNYEELQSFCNQVKNYLVTYSIKSPHGEILP